MSDDDSPEGDARPGAPNEDVRRADRTDPEYFRGEQGRSVPRSAWWVLGIALVLLLAFVIVRPSWFDRDADDDSLDVPADRHFTKSLSGAGYEDGVWLTDDSPSSSFLVAFPADSGRDETRLKLTGTTQVAQDSVVFLVIRMDGQQVFKSELPRGSNPLEALIDVPDQLSSDGQVRVQALVQGTLDDRTCTPDHSAGMQVHLDPASVVEAALDERVHTIRDAVVSWDRRVTVVLADTGDPWRTTAAHLGIALTRSGHEVTFSGEVPDEDVENTILVGPRQAIEDLNWSGSDDSDDPLQMGTVKKNPVVAVLEPDGALISRFLTTPTVETADSGQSDPQILSSPVPDGNEVGLDALGADTTVVQIADSHRWGSGYSLADLPGGRLPQAVRVALSLPAAPDDLTWILNTQLNGQLIDSRRLNSTASQVTIALPPAAQLLENSLTLTVQRDRDLGGCDVRVTTYPMQLEPSSALLLGDDGGSGFTSVPRDLAGGFAVYLPDAPAPAAIEQLNAIVPVLTKFTPAQYDPNILWNAEPAPGQPFVLIGQSATTDPLVRLTDGRIEAGPATPNLNISAFDTGMIVEPATSDTSTAGLVIQYAGSPGLLTLPAFGTEPAQVITSQGSFVIYPDGTTRASDPATANPSR
ncbi:hypothetical protein [Williamsia soli]|uniref:hypothetical protein n=1 Tax=Williamsia soli TaxID=364929 RepID=UPI001A9E63CD|nr:hypothetical protein [Williamsia soli]